jgi:hypothetical protein
LKALNQNKSFESFLAIFAFVIIGGFLFFGNATSAHAADTCTCYTNDTSVVGNYYPTPNASMQTNTRNTCDTYCNDKGGFYQYGTLQSWTSIVSTSANLKCECAKNSGLGKYDAIGDTVNEPSITACSNECQSRGATNYRYSDAMTWTQVGSLINKTDLALNKALDDHQCSIGLIDPTNWFPCLLLGVLKVLGWLLSVAAAIFGWAADSRNLTAVINGSTIYDAWKLVRDLLNMAFIIVLVYTAFTIIFQVDSSNKKIILTVVLMALLVNFSFPIARFIIDVGNSLMYTIFNNLFNGMKNPSDIYAHFADSAQLGSILNGSATDGSISQLIAAIIFVAILVVTLLVMAILFVIRIVALAIVIIFSPIAFVGAAIPSMSSKTGQWWDYLFKYTFFGPAMALMLYVAMNIMNRTIEVSAVASKNLSAIEPASPLIQSMSTFAIPIVILWIGMGLAQKMGIEGADVAKKWGNQAFKWATIGPGWARKAMKSVSKAGLETFEEGVLAKRGLSPTAFIEGWKQRSKKKRDDAISPATGAWHDRLNRWKSFGKENTRYGDAAIQASILKKQKEASDFTQDSEVLVDEFNKAEKAKDTEKMAAILRTMFNNNDQNEFMKLNGKDVDPFEMKRYMLGRLTGAGMDEQQALKQLVDLSEIANSKGNYANFGMAKFDTSTGKYALIEDDEQIGAAIGKASNLKAQTKADLWHWNSFFSELATPNADGTRTGQLHNIGKAQLNAMTELEIKVLSRVRPDFIKNVGKEESLRAIEAHAATVGGNQGEIIKNFAKTLRDLRDGKIEGSSSQQATGNKKTSGLVDQFGRPIG